MIRIFFLAILILTNFSLQATFLPRFSIMEVTPDTALVFIVGYAILRGDIEGGVFGFATGIVQDALGGTVLGFYALLGFLAGYFCGKPFKDFFKDNYFLPFFVVIGICIVYQFVVYVSTVMFSAQADFWFYFRAILLPKTIYTASLSVPLYAFLYFLNSKIEKIEGYAI
ncbi:MAG: rod shape-determining protein MreD [Defluviitaleaceae bacterium]|nr:rod shape-determining protein MreD [Defluviitaleaceae bacterium]